MKITKTLGSIVAIAVAPVTLATALYYVVNHSPDRIVDSEQITLASTESIRLYQTHNGSLRFSHSSLIDPLSLSGKHYVDENSDGNIDYSIFSMVGRPNGFAFRDDQIPDSVREMYETHYAMSKFRKTSP